MTPRAARLHVHTAPFLKRSITTPRLMGEVHLAVIPVMLAAIWFFGLGALLIVTAATAGAVGADWLFGPRPRGAALADGSTLLTGVLLGLTLPPGLPLWMAFVGGAAGIGFGKLIWGGLGANLFNPALVGRAFLQAAFPTALTTWQKVGQSGAWLSIPKTCFAPPLLHSSVDAITAATPLAAMKFEGRTTALGDLLFGTTGGSLGETSAALLLVCGLWLGMRRIFDWRIPVGIVLSVALFSTAFWVVAPSHFPNPVFMVLSGGLLFGAVFMATDPVTSPVAPKGAFVFAAGVGFLVVLIRLFGGLPEAVMYAILLMNAATPLIERATQPRAFGRSGSS